MPKKAVATVQERSAEPRRRGRRPGSTMSDEHKEAMAQGRDQGRIISKYLVSLGTRKPGRGRPRTETSPQQLIARIAEVDAAMAGADVITRLLLAQRRIDAEAALHRVRPPAAQPDSADLEAKFVKVARAYGERKGLSRKVWLEAGVPARVLDEAGIR